MPAWIILVLTHCAVGMVTAFFGYVRGVHKSTNAVRAELSASVKAELEPLKAQMDALAAIVPPAPAAVEPAPDPRAAYEAMDLPTLQKRADERGFGAISAGRSHSDTRTLLVESITIDDRRKSRTPWMARL